MEQNPPWVNKTIEDLTMKRLQLLPQDYNYWEYYLSKGSYLQVHFALNDNVTFALIQGSANFHQWLENKNSVEGVRKQQICSTIEIMEYKV
jgi:hypothetical protein